VLRGFGRPSCNAARGGLVMVSSASFRTEIPELQTCAAAGCCADGQSTADQRALHVSNSHV